jgi:hypothetical protein
MYSALGPVWAETRSQSGDWYSSGTLHPGQVLRGRLPLLSPDFKDYERKKSTNQSTKYRANSFSRLFNEPKYEDVLSPLLFNFASAYAIRKAKQDQQKLNLSGARQPLVPLMILIFNARAGML